MYRICRYFVTFSLGEDHEKNILILIVGIVGVASLSGCYSKRDFNTRIDRGLDKVVQDVNLNQEQQVKFNTLKLQIRNATRAYYKKDDGKQKMTELLDLLDAKTLSQAKANTIIDSNMQAKQAIMKDIISDIAVFTDSLSDEQRVMLKNNLSQFAKKFKRFGKYKRHHDDYHDYNDDYHDDD